MFLPDALTQNFAGYSQIQEIEDREGKALNLTPNSL